MRFPFQDAHVSEHVDLLSMPLSLDDVENTVCAWKAGDQVAALRMMLWSNYTISIGGKVCVNSFYSIISNKEINNNCHVLDKKIYKRLKELPEYEDLWNAFYETIPLSVRAKIAKSKTVLHECNNVRSWSAVANKCGIPEIWILRRHLLVKESDSYKEELKKVDYVISSQIENSNNISKR